MTALKQFIKIRKIVFIYKIEKVLFIYVLMYDAYFSDNVVRNYCADRSIFTLLTYISVHTYILPLFLYLYRNINDDMSKYKRRLS